MNSGFVTYRKNKNNDNLNNTSREDDGFIYVYRDQVEVRRKELKIGNEEKFLVVFAWCRDEELRVTSVFPGL